MPESFAVATPVLNGLPHLPGCVGSVRGQEGVQIEHFIRDAGSTDGTSEWLMKQVGLNIEIAGDDGMYDAIAQAWAAASGTVLSWLNSDEQYLPGALSAVEALFEARPDVDIVSGDAIIIDPAGNPLAARRETPLELKFLRNGPLYTLSCSLFFRRRLLDNGLLKFDLSLRYAADYDLMLGLLEAGCRTAHLSQYLSLFTVHETNLSLHPRMSEEIDIVRARRGVSKNALNRRAALAGRHIKKLWLGSYARRDLQFCHAKDEVPNYRRISRSGVGSNFSWKTEVGQTLTAGRHAHLG